MCGFGRGPMRVAVATTRPSLRSAGSRQAGDIYTVSAHRWRTLGQCRNRLRLPRETTRRSRSSYTHPSLHLPRSPEPPGNDELQRPLTPIPPPVTARAREPRLGPGSSPGSAEALQPRPGMVFADPEASPPMYPWAAHQRVWPPGRSWPPAGCGRAVSSTNRRKWHLALITVASHTNRTAPRGCPRGHPLKRRRQLAATSSPPSRDTAFAAG